MKDGFCWRHFFGNAARFRERLVCSYTGNFESDIFSLTMSQERLLRELCLRTTPESEGISLKSLADCLGLSSSAVSVMVEALVQKKVLERRPSAADRRQVLIRLTDGAWKCIDLYDAGFDRFFSGFSPEEHAVIEKIARRLAAAADDFDNEQKSTRGTRKGENK